MRFYYLICFEKQLMFCHSAYALCHIPNLTLYLSHSPLTHLTRLRTSKPRFASILPIYTFTDAHHRTSKWIEEVRSICGPTIPVILVGCKADLRPSSSTISATDTQWVTRERGERVAHAIGARAYKECSALKIEGVDDVFETATRASMLMRDGVPGGAGGVGEGRHHRRRSSAKSGVEEEKGSKCCVVC